MNLIKNFYTSYFKLFLISFFIISFIFLSGMKYDYFQFRLLILILLLPCALKFYDDLKIKNYNFLVFFLLLFVILFTHIGLNLYFEKTDITKYTLFGIIFFLSIFTISYYYFDFINRNIDFIITFFIIIFFLSSLYCIFFDYRKDADYFCGGISTFIKTNTMMEMYGPLGRLHDVRLSFREFIFPENSHLGMVAPSILAYSIYKITSQKVSILFKFFLFLFLIICLLKSSTTLLVGTILSLISIILFNYKIFNKKTLFSFFILITFFFTILATNKECRSRFVPIYGFSEATVLGFYSKNGTKNKEVVVGNLNKNLAFNLKKLMKTPGNLSSGVYFHALLIAKQSIVEKPFGWGLNRYDQAFNYFNQKNPSKIKRLNSYNNKDGTNNLVKIIVEFGVFSILFYFFIFLFLSNKKVSIELKLFYIPFIITQCLRGAGYFNGGFLLILFLMLFSYIKIYKETI